MQNIHVHEVIKKKFKEVCIIKILTISKRQLFRSFGSESYLCVVDIFKSQGCQSEVYSSFIITL